MPHQIRWLVAERVLLTTFSGVISDKELKQFIDEIRAEIRKGTPLVHHISDSLALEKVTFSLKSLQVLVGAYKMVGELGWQIDINRNPMNKMFANLATQFVNLRTRTYPTFDEGVTFLKSNDDSLANLTWHINDTEAATLPFKQEG